VNVGYGARKFQGISVCCRGPGHDAKY